jgi:hypothetical protein
VASDLLFAEVFSATDRILWYQKGNPHQDIAETIIALDACVHSTAKLSTGKLSTGKRALRRFPNFQRGNGSTSQ